MDNFLHCENIDQNVLVGSANSKTDPINIWHVDIEKHLHRIDKLQKVLTPDELERAARFHQKKDAEQFTITRALLKILLADTLSCPPESIIFISGKNKKPQLPGDTDISFNVSHSHRKAVVAIAKQNIGIDLEYVNPNFIYRSIADFAFSPGELDFVNSSNDPRTEFFRLWTRKEALLKGLGNGLINDLKLISCLNGANMLPHEVKEISENWIIKTTVLDQQYILSVAHEEASPSPKINLLTY